MTLMRARRRKIRRGQSWVMMATGAFLFMYVMFITNTMRSASFMPEDDPDGADLTLHPEVHDLKHSVGVPDPSAQAEQVEKIAAGGRKQGRMLTPTSNTKAPVGAKGSQPVAAGNGTEQIADKDNDDQKKKEWDETEDGNDSVNEIINDKPPADAGRDEDEDDTDVSGYAQLHSSAQQSHTPVQQLKQKQLKEKPHRPMKTEAVQKTEASVQQTSPQPQVPDAQALQAPALSWRELPAQGLYQLEALRIEMALNTLEEHKGKVALVVNVASACGFTDANYKGLQPLYEKYKDRGFVVLAFPCNQFGQQEPSDESEIYKFATTKYGVTFPMMSKVYVNGDNVHPVYKFLKASLPPHQPHAGEDLSWNFNKFLVNRHGYPVKWYDQAFNAAELQEDIEMLLETPP